MLRSIFLAAILISLPLVANAQVIFQGTSGDDEILVNMDIQKIKINGVTEAIPADTDVTVFAKGGNDSIRFVGDPDKIERVYLREGSAEIRQPGNTIHLEDFATIQADGNADDVAFMFDSPIKDTLEINAIKTSLSSAIFNHSVKGFKRVNVFSDWGGNDNAIVRSNEFRRLVAYPESFSLIAEEAAMNHYVEGFEQLETIAIQDFVLNDSPGESDFLKVRRNLLRFELTNYQLVQRASFKQVFFVGAKISGNADDGDRADIKLNRVSRSDLDFYYDRPADNELNYHDQQLLLKLLLLEDVVFEMAPGPSERPAVADVVIADRGISHQVNMETSTYEYSNNRTFIGFTKVDVDVPGGGNNYVEIIDSHGDDQLVLNGRVSSVSNENFEFSFDTVKHRLAMNSLQGNDTVIVYGTVEFRNNSIRKGDGVTRKTATGFEHVQAFPFPGSLYDRLFIIGENAEVAEPDREILVTPTSLIDATSERTFTAMGYPRVMITGSNSRISPTEGIDYGNASHKLKVTYDNQGDGTVELTKNKCLSSYYDYFWDEAYYQVGWEWRTSNTSVFVARFGGLRQYGGGTPFETKGINNVQVLNTPADMPVVVFPLRLDKDY